MAIITFTGNLTKDAVLHTYEGRKYILLQVAENIRKKNDKGEYEKDAEGHFISVATYYHSVFVNNGNLAFQVQDLKKGDPIRISGIAQLKIIKDSNNYDQYSLDSIVARWVDTNPFNTPTESDVLTSETIPDDIPFVA